MKTEHKINLVGGGGDLEMAFTKMSQKRGNKALLMQCQETGEEEGSNYQNVAEVEYPGLGS